MTPCDGTADSEKWCCGAKKDCCGTESAQKAVIVPRKLGQKASESATASAASAASSSTGTPAADLSAQDSQQSSFSSSSSESSYKIGLGVGIGVGFPVMVALGIVLGMFVFQRKDKEAKAQEVQGNEVGGMGMGHGQVKRQATDDSVELMTPVSELWGDRRMKAELA